MTTTCRTGDRTFQRLTALENQLGQWRSCTSHLWATRSIDGSTDPSQWAVVDLGEGGIQKCWYIRIGQRLHPHYAIQWGTPRWYAAPGRIMADLPPNVVGENTASQYLHFHLWTTSGTAGPMNFVGSALVRPGPGSNLLVQPMFPFSARDYRLGQYAIAGPADGQRAWSVPYIATGFPDGGLLEIQAGLALD